MASAGASGDGASRAAWWLARDGVKPIADLVNAEAGKGVRFRDRVGGFRVEASGRAVVVSGRQ